MGDQVGMLDDVINDCNGKALHIIRSEANLANNNEALTYLIDLYKFLNVQQVCSACGHNSKDDLASDLPEFYQPI